VSDQGGWDLRFEVLGPLRVRRGDVQLSLGPVQQQVVLAVLLLRANKPVSRDRLIDAVWGSAVPAYAVNLVQKYVSGLRRALEPARPAREPSRLLAWTGSGYRLTVPDAQLDLAVFEREVGRARAARAADDLSAASDAFHAAVQLWRGSVCEGLSSPFLDGERNRFADYRISVVEERIDVELALGRHAEVVPELQQLVAAHPLRERLRGLLMLALYRSGRQADALAVFHDARRHLLDELGVEPAEPLQTIYRQILNADPVLLGAAAQSVNVDVGIVEGAQKPASTKPAREPPDFGETSEGSIRNNVATKISSIALLWSAVLLTFVALLFVWDAKNAPRWAVVLGTLTALAGLTASFAERAVAWVSGRRRRQPGEGEKLAGLRRAAEELADAVRDEWREEARTRRLQDPWPLPLRWTAAEADLADHVDVVFKPPPEGGLSAAAGPDSLSGQLADAVELYERLPSRRLVILGVPGSGKSVLAMTLTLAILDRWQSGMPVPVLFPVASWDPSRAGLDDWLVEYLVENYQFGGEDNKESRVVARRLLAGNTLLPILDGLDEMPQALRPLAIKTLNRGLDPTQPIVVTCRTDEYREAVESGDVLTLAAVVELQALDIPTIIKYLTETTPAGQRGERWAPVFDELRNNQHGPLGTVLRTPLMVSLARAIYGDNPRDPAELLDRQSRDPARIEDHLLSEFVPAMYYDRPSRTDRRHVRWHTDDVTSWLSYLARHVGALGQPDLAWWQMERAVPAVVINAVGGLLGGLVFGFVFGPVFGIALAVAVVLAGMAARSRPCTLEEWLKDRLDSGVRRVVARQSIGEAVAAVAGLEEKTPIERRFGLAVGRVIALVAGISYGLSEYHSKGLFRAIADGLAVGLAVGLAAGFFTIAVRTTPSEVQFEARKGIGVFLRHLAVGLATGLGVGVVAGILTRSAYGLLTCVLVGLSFGLVDGLNVWLDVSTDVTQARSPRSTRRAERTAALARSVTVGLTIAATTALAFGVAYGTRSAVIHALTFGIGYGLADRYAGLGPTVWGRYLVAKAWLALNGRLPWRLMAFLDDAHRHGLLRRAGAAYQFRHLRLQEHLSRSASAR